MKVLFMGTPAFAAASLIALIEAGHDVVGVVTRPDAPAGRGRRTRTPPVKDIALAHRLAILQPEEIASEHFLDRIRALGAEIIAVVAYGRILPRQLLEAGSRGAINLHASLLPKLRGASPIVWAIARGERETGVTTMRMVRKLDAGDILLQRSTPIGPDETAGQLEARLAGLGAGLLVETLAELEKGRITPRPQDDSMATWAPMLRKTDGIIDWGLPAAQITRLVRAFDPWPAAQTNRPGRGGGPMRLWKASAMPDAPAVAAPGTVLRAVKPEGGQAGGLLVACGEGTTLLVTELQPEGRRRMTALEAISGRYLEEGDRLGVQ